MTRQLAGTLIDIVDRLDAVDDSDRFASLIIYADGGADATASARAVVCAGGDGLFCPKDPRLSEVLMVQLAISWMKLDLQCCWRGLRQRA